MPHTPRSRIISHAAGTAVSIGVGMIPFHRLPHPVRTGYIVLPAAFTSGLLLLAQQRSAPRRSGVEGESEGEHEHEGGSPRRLRMPTASEYALSLALGGAMAGAGAASIHLDRGIENLLRRRGVSAPRVVMGLGSGALMLAVNMLEGRAPAADDASSLEHRVLEVLTEADPMEFAPGRFDGTPADEYRPEAESIAALLRTDGVITEVRLDEVWQDWFSEPLTAVIGSERVTVLVETLNALSHCRR